MVDNSGAGGGNRRIVAAGESIFTIAVQSGHFWKTIWEHPENATLVETRKDPAILQPGDEVFVPPLEQAYVRIATGRKHVFRRRGVPSVLRLRLLDGSEARAGEPFRLELDGGRIVEGRTDAQGLIEVWVPATLRHAVLTLGDDDPVDIDVGTLLPIDNLDGVKQRLRNLGLLDGSAHGSEAGAVREALLAFQALSGLAATGEFDSATRAALLEAHDLREPS